MRKHTKRTRTDWRVSRLYSNIPDASRPYSDIPGVLFACIYLFVFFCGQARPVSQQPRSTSRQQSAANARLVELADIYIQRNEALGQDKFLRSAAKPPMGTPGPDLRERSNMR